MKILINNRLLETKTIVINEDFCFINNNRHALSELSFPELKINIHRIIRRITDGLISELTFVISDDLDGISIEYFVSKNRTEGSTVKIGRNLLNVDDEIILTIFIAHEIGHILYSQNEYDFDVLKDQILKASKFVLCFIIAFLCHKISYTFVASTTLISASFISSFCLKKIHKLLSKINNFNSEFYADVYAVDKIGNPRDVIKALELIRFHFGESRDSITHPSIAERILNIKQHFWFKLLMQDLIFWLKNLFKMY